MPTRPAISIVTTFDNCDDYHYDDRGGQGYDRPMLTLLLEALETQTVAPSEYELVVINPSTHIDWKPVFEEFMAESERVSRLNFRFYDMPEGGRGWACNCGIEKSSADIITFLSGDHIPEPTFVETHLEFHRQNPEEHKVAIGPGVFPALQREDDFCRWLEDSGSLFGVSFTAPKGEWPSHFFYGANSSVKRTFLDKAGHLDTDFPYPAWDDYELGVRLRANGLKSTCVPLALACHRHEVTLDDRRAGMKRAGESARIFERKYPGPQPWHSQCKIAPSPHRLRARAAKTCYDVTRLPYFREAYYRSELNAQFSAGYRETLD